MPGTSIALSAAANAQAAAAAAEAHEAHVAACQGLVPNFHAETATTAAQMQYADCVHLLNPQPLGGVEVLVIKIFIVGTLLGMAAGGTWGWRDKGMGGDVESAVIGGLFGLCAAPVALAIVLGSVAGVWYLFS